MKTLELVQGTPEWHAIRLQHGTASEAPAMMGRSKYMSRTKLLDLKKTGLTEEITPQQQRLFDKGHAAEAKIRPVVEKLIGESLYPVTGSEVVDNIPMLASFDGITMMEDIVFEHKLWNEDLAEQVRTEELDAHYYWQLEQQLLVPRAKKALFVVSDGTEKNMAFMWYQPQPGRAEKLVAGWRQFFIDLEAHEPTEAAPVVVGRAPDALPALRIELTGMVTASNLAEFKAASLAVIDSINTDLQTDNDFADAEQTVKFFKGVEEKLAAAKDHALSQTASIDELFRTIDAISEQARAKRLELDKLVKTRKQVLREQIVLEAKTALGEHIVSINKTLDGVLLSPPHVDFAGAIKGKRTIQSLRDAADTELAHAYIAANQAADQIRANLKSLDELAADHRFLFNDLQQVVTKPADDFTALVKMRIAEHKAEEERRLEAELARRESEIRAEEERKRQTEEARIRAEEGEAIRKAMRQQEASEGMPVHSEEPAPYAIEPATQEDLFNVSIRFTMHDLTAEDVRGIRDYLQTMGAKGVQVAATNTNTNATLAA